MMQTCIVQNFRTQVIAVSREEGLVQALSAQLRIPTVDVSTIDVAAEVLQIVPLEMALQHNIMGITLTLSQTTTLTHHAMNNMLLYNSKCDWNVNKRVITPGAGGAPSKLGTGFDLDFDEVNEM